MALTNPRDYCGHIPFQANPPTERGWRRVPIPPSYVSVPPVARLALESHAVPDPCSVDRTFENEVRPR